MPLPNLALCCPAERFFNDFRASSVGLFGAENTLTYTSVGDLIGQLMHVIGPIGGFQTILIAGHGQMGEDNGAPIMLGRLTAGQWTDVVALMVQRGIRARIVVLDGCKSAAFSQIFTPLLHPEVAMPRGCNTIVCNLGDSSTTVFGQLQVGHSIGQAVQAKMLLENAQNPRPGKSFVAPNTVPEVGGQSLRFVGLELRLADYPDMSEANVRLAFSDFADWLDQALVNRQSLAVEALRQGAVNPWSATLFIPTALCERDNAGTMRIVFSGPFHSPDDMKAAYEHWQRYGPGGMAALVFRDEIEHVLNRLAANMAVLPSSVTLGNSVAALTETINPNAPLDRLPRPSVKLPPRRPGTVRPRRGLA